MCVCVYLLTKKKMKCLVCCFLESGGEALAGSLGCVFDVTLSTWLYSSYSMRTME